MTERMHTMEKWIGGLNAGIVARQQELRTAIDAIGADLEGER